MSYKYVIKRIKNSNSKFPTSNKHLLLKTYNAETTNTQGLLIGTKVKNHLKGSLTLNVTAVEMELIQFICI